MTAEPEDLYDAVCRVIDAVKTDDRNLDTDEYAGRVMDAIKRHRPVIQLLHVRDPDSACDTRLFLDDVEVDWRDMSLESVDPGAGWDAEDWRERVKGMEAEPPSRFRDAVLEALGNPPGKAYISGWGDD